MFGNNQGKLVSVWVQLNHCFAFLVSGVNSDDWQNTFLAIILVLVVLINVCGAIYQGAVLGAAAKFPTKYMTAAMTGQSVGGIFPVVVDIVVTSADIPDRCGT